MGNSIVLGVGAGFLTGPAVWAGWAEGSDLCVRQCTAAQLKREVSALKREWEARSALSGERAAWGAWSEKAERVRNHIVHHSCELNQIRLELEALQSDAG